MPNVRRMQTERQFAHAASTLLTAALVALSIAIPTWPRNAGAQSTRPLHAAQQTAFDARAMQLLQKMADAYTHLTALDQQTEFYASSFPVQFAPDGRPITKEPLPDPDADTEDMPPLGVPKDRIDRSLRLIVAQPNRLRVELREPDPDSDRNTHFSEWVSDGKWFWSYSTSKEHNWYTKEKAPARLSEFGKLAHLSPVSLELMMLIGINPFADIREQADSVEYMGTTTIRGIPTDIVVMQTRAPAMLTQVRIYIGKEDLLLHRLFIQTSPIPAPPAPGKVGDALDSLVPGASAPAQTSQATTADNDVSPESRGPILRRVSYDNIVSTQSAVDLSAFSFKIPQGASLYAPFDPKNGFNTKLRIQDLYAGLVGRKPRKLRIVRP